MRKKLNSYRGNLTAAQVAAGINAAADNARRLCEDANILLTAGRFPAAASLSIIAIEELGKMAILEALAVARSDSEIKERWNDYHTHTKKNAHRIFNKLVEKGAKKFDDLKAIFDKESDHPYRLDNTKQIAFYTDCLGEAKWSIPSKVIGEQLATNLVKFAKYKCECNSQKVTEREIELWREHIGPVWRKGIEPMKQGFANLYTALRKEGLIPKGPSQVEDFFMGL